MTPQQAIPIIERAIQGQRHQHYDHTVKMAELCHSMMTGTNQVETLKRFRSRETDSQMTQRERLFLSPTRGFLSPIENVYEKIRFLDSEAIKRWSEMPENKESLLEKAINNTWENQKLNEYLYDIEKYYNFYDPNAFAIIEESRLRDDENAVMAVDIYPIEARAIEVVNYELRQGRVMWAVFEFKGMEELASKPGVKQEISKFYLYAPGAALEYYEYIETIPPQSQYTLQIKVGSQVRNFGVSVYETTTIEAPVMRLGCYLDPETKNETFIPPYWPAILKLEEAIRDKSMQDINIPAHYYPKEYALAPKCEYYDEDLSIKCDNGHIYHDGNDVICPACKGTGHNLHISEQDRIVLALPDEGLDLPDLSKLLYWHTPPEWLPQYADQRLKELERSVFWLTFNTQLMDKPTGDATATGEHMDYESIQQKLTPYAKVISDNWRKYIRVCVQYLEAWTDDFTVEHSFPKDHKLQTSAELMQDFGDAKNKGLAYPILEAIEDKILSKQRVDDPASVAMYRAFRNHLPFKDKSESTAARIVSERDREDFDRLIWENSDKVYRILQDQHKDFANTSMEGQRAIIQTILDQIKGQILYAQDPVVGEPNFG